MQLLSNKNAQKLLVQNGDHYREINRTKNTFYVHVSRLHLCSVKLSQLWVTVIH